MNTFNVTLDCLYSEVNKRGEKYSQLHNRFGFLEVIKGSLTIYYTRKEILTVYYEDLDLALIEEF